MAERERCEKTGKQRLSKRDAMARVSYMRRHYLSRIDAYRCPSCTDWHVGHHQVHKPKYVRR